MDTLSYLHLPLRIDSTRHPRWKVVAEYCWELAALDMDIHLTRVSFLERFYEIASSFEPPESPDGLILKKFLVTHAEESLCHRLYAYREKVWQLLNATFLLGRQDRDRQLGRQVAEWLHSNEPTLFSVVDNFWRRDPIKELIEQRHGITHRLSKHQIKTLGQARRLAEWLAWGPEMDRLLDQDETDVAISTFAVDDYRDRVNATFEMIQDDLSQFEDTLCRQVLEGLSLRGPLRRAP